MADTPRGHLQRQKSGTGLMSRDRAPPEMPGRPRSIVLALRGAVACRFQTSLPFIFCLLPPREQSTESYCCRFVRSQELRFGLSRGGASAFMVVSTLTLTDGSCAMGGGARAPRAQKLRLGH